MINLNSPIKSPLMISESRQAVPGKDSSYFSQTPAWGQWLPVQEIVSLRELPPGWRNTQTQIIPHTQLPMERNYSLQGPAWQKKHKLANIS